MNYSSFLLFLNQISSQRKAKVILQGSIIFVEMDFEAQTWDLSTKILRAENRKTKKQLESILPNKTFQWQEKGAYLVVNEERDFVYLKQKVNSSKKYLLFKSLMEDFASIASEWKGIFESAS